MYDLELPPELPRAELDRRIPYVLLPADHPLAGAPLDLRELERVPMVLLDAPPSSNHALSVCAQADIRPTIGHRTKNYETARALVGRGLGWTVLVTRPRVQMTYEGRAVVATELKYPVPDPVRVVLVWPDNSALSRRAREFIRYATGEESAPSSDPDRL